MTTLNPNDLPTESITDEPMAVFINPGSIVLPPKDAARLLQALEAVYEHLEYHRNQSGCGNDHYALMMQASALDTLLAAQQTRD